jgi:hypothetical protein
MVREPMKDGRNGDESGGRVGNWGGEAEEPKREGKRWWRGGSVAA